jgi:DNA-binding CsgD family transcriptional regulator
VAEVLAGSIEQSNSQAPHEQLSDREFEVFKMIVNGKSISAIGEILSLNVNTISTYRSRIMEKMHLQNNADLVKYAIMNNII